MRDIVVNLLKEAIDKLYRIDKENIEAWVSEQNLCARLAYHLENLMRDNRNFNGYYVDVEYNRMVKQGSISGKKVFYNNRPVSVVCDLLIHSRDEEKRNLLALEMKKKGNNRNVENDKQRLISLVSTENEQNRDCVCNTLVGVFMEIRKENCYLEYYDENQVNPIREIYTPTN